MAEHGGRIVHERKDILDFSANIHPNGIPGGIKEAMKEALEEVIHYPDPDCRKLRAAIAGKHRINEEQILCGNGAAELIFHLAFVLHAKKVLLPIPSFLEYEEAFRIDYGFETKLHYYEMPQFRMEEDLIEQMDESFDILILCQPNNPTGLLIDAVLLRSILEKAEQKGIFVLLDECFLDFVIGGKMLSMISHMEKYPHLLILKSFTKMYGIPGIRLGYLMTANSGLLGQIRRSMQPWSVSHIAQRAGIAALELENYEEKSAIYIEEQRRQLQKDLRELGFLVWEGQANFLFFQAAGREKLAESCLEEGICIRSCDNYVGLGKDYYRVAIRNAEDNKRLMETLRKIVGEEER